MTDSHKRPLRVLESVGAIKPTTNPYLSLLIDALRRRDDVDVELFSFPRAMFGRYDVFHVHWPEVIFGGHRPIGRLVRRTLTSLLILRLAITRTPIVRTWHNTERPSGISHWDERILDWFDGLTRVRIRLNQVTELAGGIPVVTIPLGHYRDWYAGRVKVDAIPGRVAYVGLIRRYKGVEDLVSAFRGVTVPGATLHISGKPSSDELRSTIADIAGDDDRIVLRFGFIADDEFVREATEASLIALPFVHMHNSSTVLTALSLERPVLVPDNPVNRSLAAEFGTGWIQTYEGDLTGSAIDDALRETSDHPPVNPPRLDARGWDEAARRHVEAFRLALRPQGQGASTSPLT